MYFKLPALPFKTEEVSKWISSEIIELHYNRHHKSYVEKLNTLLKGSGFENSSLEEIVKKSTGALFNNAAQAWNHTFYWLGIRGETPKEKNPLAKYPALLEAINKSFGSVEKMKIEFAASAGDLFGSGWVWLVYNQKNGKIEIMQTTNAGNPIRYERKPLLVCDVWEHAYYVDFLNLRGKYIEGFLEFINWEFVDLNFRQEKTCNLTNLMKTDRPNKEQMKSAMS